MSEKGGILDEVRWDRTMDSSCSDSPGSDSSWEMVSSTHAKGTDSGEWNEIPQYGTNIWRFSMSFVDRPESIFPNHCRSCRSCYKPTPQNFQYDISIGWDSDPSDLYFDDHMPEDGDGNSDNEELGLLLDILGGVGGHYTAVGTTLIDFAINSGWFSSGVSFDDPGNNGSSFEWDIPLNGGYDDLPHEENGEINSVEVRLRVNNEYSSGTHSLEVGESYTFEYYTDEDKSTGRCVCQSPITEFKKTATPLAHSPEFDVP